MFGATPGATLNLVVPRRMCHVTPHPRLDSGVPLPVKRVPLIIVSFVLLGALGLAAPALSARHSPPRAVEWEQEAPQRPVSARAASARGLLAAPVRPGRRFNLAGLRWRGSDEVGIAVRARTAGGKWGRWTSVPTQPDGGPDPGRGESTAPGAISAPVLTGDADALQYRLSRPLPGLRLHFVNTLGTATRAARARTAVRGLAARAVVALGGMSVARGRQAAPAIVPRAAWGADQCQPRSTPEYGEVRAAVVHHTVTANAYTPAQAPAAVLAICRYHRNSNGWNDVGYNFLVDKFGTVYEGRAGGIDQPVIGAQAQGVNAQTTGIANIGDYSVQPQTPAALDAIARLIRWKLPLHGQPTAGSTTVLSSGGASSHWRAGTTVALDRVVGHRDTGSTSCPGDALYAQLADLRARVGSVQPTLPAPVAPPGPAPVAAPSRTRLEAAVRPGVLSFGQLVQVEGRLRLLSGTAVAQAPVEIQASTPRGWRRVATATTGGDGSFRAGVTRPGRSLLRARFAGDGQRLTSLSRGTVLEVRPAFNLARSTARASVGRTPTVAGRIGPAKGRVIVVVERRVGRRNVRLARFVVRPRGGRFRKGWRLRQPGLHRFIAVFPGDRRNLAVSSAPVYVRGIGSTRGGGTRAR